MTTTTEPALTDAAALLASTYGLTAQQADEAMTIMSRNALNAWYGAAALSGRDPNDLDAMNDHWARTFGPQACRDAEELAVGTVLRAAAEAPTRPQRRPRAIKTNRARVHIH
ncbi:hypothetical protein ACH4UT_10380 [Streptomyces sp. NPDC020799]|uniref:hypothetical protein n=1 Tax=Streptomyces sp. NPDC020799 TaxID=3365091 RepID=UPI00379034F4